MKNVDILFPDSKYPLIWTIYFSPALPFVQLAVYVVGWGTNSGVHTCVLGNEFRIFPILSTCQYLSSHPWHCSIMFSRVRLKIQCSRNRNWLCINFDRDVQWHQGISQGFFMSAGYCCLSPSVTKPGNSQIFFVIMCLIQRRTSWLRFLTK